MHHCMPSATKPPVTSIRTMSLPRELLTSNTSSAETFTSTHQQNHAKDLVQQHQALTHKTDKTDKMNLFRCLSDRDERRRDALRERMLREAHERNAQRRQAARNEELRARFPQQTTARYQPTVRRAHTVHARPTQATPAPPRPQPQPRRGRHAIRNAFEGSEVESYVYQPNVQRPVHDLRVGMVSARSRVPEPFYSAAQHGAERHWERAVPDIAIAVPRSTSRTTTTGAYQPQPSTADVRVRIHAHTVHRSRSAEAPEVYDPQRREARVERSRRVPVGRRNSRPAQPVGQCPPGWI